MLMANLHGGGILLYGDWADTGHGGDG
jgi:hypothetical protein